MTREEIADRILEKRMIIIVESGSGNLKVEEMMDLFDEYDELTHQARIIEKEGK